MDIKIARNLVKDTFENGFDKNRFYYFIKNLLNEIEEEDKDKFIYRGNFIPDAYRPYIKTLERIGKYQDPKQNKIDLLIVQLKKETSLERARAMQRNFIAWYLNGSRGGVLKDAALVAFVSPNQKDWRFSLVKMQYRLGKKGKIKQELTPAKRSSFLVGENEASHTAQSQLVPLIIDDENNPTLEQLEEAFSVEKVTKEFYKKLANWYFWAIRNVEFPKHAEEKKNGRKMAVIRLITRLIFVWFMKQKGLIPEYFFKKEGVEKIIKDLPDDKSTYYKAILQNLFFATLNTPQDKRRFTDEVRGYKGYNPDFGNHNVYRYHELFKNSGKIKDYFGKIPFLNGGLFECLDIKAKNREDRRYIDGFTRVEKYQPKVPNFLFFAKEQSVDLNREYGTKNKKYLVEGIINLLSSYNFTIDENTPDDQDVALDPELLGKVFENLLASFNPETATTARKATGSYYTPREIVDYMVTESLKAYFKTHLSDIKDLGQKLELLFSKENEENPFNQEESKRIVNLIDDLRIVDPAVGSGAFPMGILNKLVFILNKIDAGNRLWKQTQLSAAEKIPDPIIKQKVKENIEKFFREKNPDYGRKLYLIQKCIYGVDIQEIAVEIAKLRFFISLLVDEKIDNTKPNWGIEPLPNLDFKLMVGNSLIDKVVLDDTIIEIFNLSYLKQTNHQVKYKNLFEIDPQEDLFSRLRKSEVAAKVEEFIKKKEELFRESDLEKKRKLKEEINSLENEIIRISLQEELRRVKEQLANRFCDGVRLGRKELIQKKELEKKQKFLQDLINNDQALNKYKHQNIFLWQLHFIEVFLEKGGFDIVIANPPYDVVKDKKYRERYAESIYGRMNLYGLFIHQSIENIVKPSGHLTFINPKTLLADKYFVNLRKFLELNGNFKVILKIADRHKVFDNVLQAVIVYIFQKRKSDNSRVLIHEVHTKKDIENIKKRIAVEPDRIWLNNRLNYCILVSGKREVYSIFDKILLKTKGFRQVGIRFATGKIQWDLFKSRLIAEPTKTSFRLIWAENIQRYRFADAEQRKGKEFIGGLLDIPPNIITKTIITQRTTADEQERRIIATIFDPEKEGYLAFSENNTNYLIQCPREYSVEFVLSLLNSKFFDLIFRHINSNTHVSSGELNSLPIKPLSLKEQQPFVRLVNKILTITKDDDYLENPAKQAKVREYEKQIDQLVYKLYGLTEEEIRIIEKT